MTNVKMIVITVMLSAVTLLSGCGLQNMQLHQDRQRCSQYGYQKGTDAFAKCMQKTAIERDRMNMIQAFIPLND
ncbi:hypothetical protein ASE93_03210 [Serratia sp. Leaf50]|uniref:hypothetical protein n=1 Tax=Rouxiella sp. S1S-2 TaxID=2653856 RepID=UPI0006F409BA|nr:hypothetical protein [Rouxiella sp. S1S-2]KAB7896661.1 hypothetical protein GA565_12105 [Rouxiella sp. S1S-2]KQN52165.1 hypothetical protein ASE93_03210 [Serratia sp. Leaf50]